MMISDLPKDLESEILSRVPAKSLWELRKTCKRWYALIRDRKFVEKNKKKLGEAVRESILLSNLKVYAIAGDLLQNNNYYGSIEFKGKLKGSKDLNFSEIFHCDGLMLCSTKRNKRLVVWNPCTGQTRSIKPRDCYRYDDAYALGYTTSSSSGHNSYKILRRFSRQNDQVPQGEMYDLSSDSWRVLDSFPLGYSVNRNGVSLKGDTYFVAREKETDAFLITKFDFTTETLVRLPLPFQDLDSQDKAFLSVVRDEKLSLLHIDNMSEGVMRIWVTNKIDDEAKDFSWRSDFVLELYFYRQDMYFESFLLDEENKVAVLCGVVDFGDKFETGIYIVGEYTFEQVYEATVSTFNWPRIITYAPSLVHIQKSTPKRHKKQRLAL